MRFDRRVALAVACVLVVGACSGGGGTQVFGDATTTTTATTTSGAVSTTSAPSEVRWVDPDPLEIGEEGVLAASAIVAAVGDQAPAATFLAFERGYSLDQVIEVGSGESTIDGFGNLLSAGALVRPDGDRLMLIGLAEDPADGISQVRSSRQSGERKHYDLSPRFDLGDLRDRVTESVDAGERPSDARADTGEAVVGWIILLLGSGYSMEQVVQAVVLGGHLGVEDFPVSAAEAEDFGLEPGVDYDYGEEHIEVTCATLIVGGEPTVPALFGSKQKPYCRDLLDGRFGFPGVRGVYARSTRPGSPLSVVALFSSEGDEAREDAWLDDADLTWSLDGEVISTETTRRITYDHDFATSGTHTVGLDVVHTSGETWEFTADFIVLPFFDVGLGPLLVVGEDGSEWPVSFVLYPREKVRFTPIIQGYSGTTVPDGFIEFDRTEEWGFDLLQPIEPPDLGLEGLVAFIRDYQVLPPRVQVELEARDYLSGDSAGESFELLVSEAPADPTAWGGGGSCSGESEGTEYSTQWQVRMTDNGDGTWTADIYYHDCPNRGRAHYRGPAAQITPYRWAAQVEFVDGKGPLGANAPAQMPGPLSHYLVSQFGFEGNVQETIGVN